MSRGPLLGAAVALLALVPAALGAQVVPSARWRTIRTTHFHVHFTPELDSIGRRAAADAEDAYARLATRLHPPRGPIDLVVSDNVDYSNGYTTPFPTNRIIVYVHPPLDVPSLRYYDDWLSLVITHELTHVFHLDRTRGWWRVAQHVFGRAPFLFPNLYDPAWVTEGLATYFESDVTGAGRVEGTYERMLLESTVERGGLLPYDRWNLVSTRFPGGDAAYGFGALFFEHLAERYGRDKVRAFVERSSGETFPFTLNRAAKGAFGISFASAWREWRDSLAAHARPSAMPLAGWRDLSRGGHVALYPRWLGDSALLYAGTDWTSSPAAWRVDTAGAARRLGRRNDAEPGAVLPDGSVLFSQLDFTDPYHIRADLWIARGGAEHRLTSGARLAQPDARRSDGAIIAIRYLAATAQLVRVSADGRAVTPLVAATPDTEWAEPRWSPRGDRIAVMRWTRGGFVDVVVLDTLGHLVRAITHDRAVDSSPSWSADGKQVIFASDRTGTAELYVAPAEGAGTLRRFTRSSTGVFYPAQSPDGRSIAASRYGAAGWHVGIAPFDTSGADTPALDPAFAARPLPPAGRSDAPEHAFSPWGGLVPRYWLPIVGQTTTGGYSIGAFTSGSDVVGRHSYYAQALFDPAHGEHAFDGSYQYAGLGQPVITLGGTQYWDRQSVLDTDRTVAGDLVRRTRRLSLDFTVSRPRVRTNAFLSVGGELEARRYTTDPAPLLGRLVNYYQSGPRYWSLVASTGWSNAQHPVLAISPEDGLSFAATGRLRWLEGGGGVQSRSVSAVLDAYKSLDLGGYAHHVLAARVAGGAASGLDPGEFDVGGSNGTPVDLFPGFTLGSHHTFAVRGFPSGARSGREVAAGSLEWRAPLGTPRRGLGFWPVFLDRTSLSVFGDAGTAWGTPGLGVASDWLGSVGAELDLDTGLQYDAPYRLRVGFAVPVAHPVYVKTNPVSVYFQLGYAF